MGRPPLDRKTRRAAAQNMIHSAEQLIEEDGSGHVTIRKIANRADVNSAALYHYFTDVDELLMFACMDIMRLISENVDEVKAQTEDTDPMTRYTRVWEVLCSDGFRNPELTSHVLFGKHSEDIERIVRKYLTIFPAPEHEDDDEPDPERMKSLINHFDFRSDVKQETAGAMNRDVDDPHVEIVTELMMGYYRMLLGELAQDRGNSLSAEEQTEKMLKAAKYLMQKPIS